MNTICNYINGRFEENVEDWIVSEDPSTGEPWARIPNSTEETVERSIKAAREAFPNWSSTSANQRAAYLKKVANLLEERLDEFALAESKDQGKPLWLAREVDIPRAVLNLRSFAESIPHRLNTSNTMENTVNYTIRKPLGVAALIVPWNLPLYLLTFKIAPALMSGNTVICKPSEMTSVTAWMLAQLFDQVGMPPGTINIVCGYGNTVGDLLVRHPDVPIVSFTGSTAIGQRIASIASPLMKHLSLELGGKNAAVIFNDVDVEKAIPVLMRSCFLNQGEVCLSTSRVFIQAGIYEEFSRALVKATQKLNVGKPSDKESFIGPLISKSHLEKVTNYVKVAKQGGGTVETGELEESGNEANQTGGYYMRPTIISGLPDSSPLMNEEIFGPVVCITKFSNEAEVVRRVNQVQYGLCASVWSQNSSVLHRMASVLDVGTVWLNCWLVRSLAMPFGGSKMSGIGREGLEYSLDTFTSVKTVCLRIDEHTI